MSVLAVEHPRLTVVLVEDDDADAKAMRRALSGSTAAGTVLRAVDGVAALDLLRGAHGPMPDRFLVLTDINMPRMDGLEFIRTLRADPDLHRAVVFLLTSSDTVEDREAAYDEHVAGYVLKQDHARFIELLNHYWTTVVLPEIRPGGDAHARPDHLDRR